MSAPKRVNAMELLVVDSEVRPDAVLVHARGEIDSSTSGELRSQLETALQQAGASSHDCSSSIYST